VTGARFGGVDLDLLADFLVGELDEADRARVAGLIGTDPAWADAYHQLGAADEVIAGQLRSLGAAPEPMPADVVARLDRALSGAATDNVISLADVRQRRQRRYRLLTAAAASVLAVFGGVVVVRSVAPDLVSPASMTGGSAERGPLANQDGSTSGDSGGGEAGAPSSVAFTTVATGRNYTTGDVGVLRDMTSAKEKELWLRADGSPGPAISGTAAPQVPDSDLAARVPPDLRHFLTDPVALSRCVELVDRLWPGRPLFVDLARYQGYAAVVVILTDPAGIAVRSPDCVRDLT
jgi:hypothetical protein